ncbi:MAG TPA: hypothetical protein VL400_22690 [Polyangiaceae bacterium]|jgi:hypothetical protein|nr:hypothetical protein [Polyangiaceae bacterium]
MTQFSGDVVELLWCEPEVAARARRKPEWRAIADAVAGEGDAPGLTDEPAAGEDRLEVTEILKRGAPAAELDVDDALATAVRPDGRFAPKMLLLAGEVVLDLDEIEELRATAGAARRFASDDLDIEAALARATAFLATTALATSRSVAADLTREIEAAFVKTPRDAGPTWLREQAERALLERRSYQRRDVFGQRHLSARFFQPGSATGIPTYLPEALAASLPLFRRLRLRMLVEVHFQADQYAAHRAALRAVAVARTLTVV